MRNFGHYTYSGLKKVPHGEPRTWFAILRGPFFTIIHRVPGIKSKNIPLECFWPQRDRLDPYFNSEHAEDEPSFVVNGGSFKSSEGGRRTHE